MPEAQKISTISRIQSLLDDDFAEISSALSRLQELLQLEAASRLIADRGAQVKDGAVIGWLAWHSLI
ncbi:hypothetical protein ACYQR9_15130 [Methylobacterium sp. CM6241]